MFRPSHRQQCRLPPLRHNFLHVTLQAQVGHDRNLVGTPRSNPHYFAQESRVSKSLELAHLVSPQVNSFLVVNAGSFCYTFRTTFSTWFSFQPSSRDLSKTFCTLSQGLR